MRKTLHFSSILLWNPLSQEIPADLAHEADLQRFTLRPHTVMGVRDRAALWAIRVISAVIEASTERKAQGGGRRRKETSRSRNPMSLSFQYGLEGCGPFAGS
jgi:hypothetical protein